MFLLSYYLNNNAVLKYMRIFFYLTRYIANQQTDRVDVFYPGFLVLYPISRRVSLPKYHAMGKQMI